MLRGFADFRLVVNGVILVVIVLFLPQGIWDPARFKRWMRQEASAVRAFLRLQELWRPACAA